MSRDVRQFAAIEKGAEEENGVSSDSNTPSKGTEDKTVQDVLEGTELYGQLQAAITEYAKGKGEYETRRKAVQALYQGVSQDIDGELTADLVGDYLFTDGDFINRLSSENRSLFQKLFDEIKYLCRIATAGSKEKRKLEQAKHLFEAAYRANSQALGNSEGAKNTADSGGVQYSLVGLNQSGIEVYETSQDVLKMSSKERKAQYLDMMKNEFRERTAKFNRNGHVYYARFDQSSIRKPIYGDSRSSKDGAKALIKAGADGDVFDLVENATYTRSKVNTKNHTKADYFDYFVKTVQIDGKVFDLVADVEKKYGGDGGYVYTLALVDNNKIKASPAHGTPKTGPVKSAGNASTTNLSQNNQNVNQNSLSADGGGQGQYGNLQITGEDVRLETLWEGLRQMAQPKDTDNVDAPTHGEVKQAVQEPEGVATIEDRMADLEEQLQMAIDAGDEQNYYRLASEYSEMKLEQEKAKKPRPTKLTKRRTDDITRQVRKEMDLSNREMAAARDIIERFRAGEIGDREQLVLELQSKLGRFTVKDSDEYLADVKGQLRDIPVKVTEDVKNSIGDYKQLRKRNFGKIRFSKDGIGVDEAYAAAPSVGMVHHYGDRQYSGKRY